MNDYKNWEKKVEENRQRNEKYVNEFKDWLNNKDLVKKTINKHLSNVNLYLNDYLNYYDITKMEDGIYSVYSFLDVWFIEKCMWASKSSIKDTAANIKKFYQCMSEKNHVSVEDYKYLCKEIKENMAEILEHLENYDNGTYYDIF